MSAEHRMGRRSFLAGSAALFLASGCSSEPLVIPHSTPYYETKLYPQVSAEHIETGNNLSQEDLIAAEKYRNDFYRILREFTPNDYLARGVYAFEDGPGHWSSQVKNKYVKDGLYAMRDSVTMGPDGQRYSVSNYYDETDILKQTVFLPGNVPALIDPDQIPTPIPGVRYLHIPRDVMRDVAEAVFDLPPNLEWRTDFVYSVPYMSHLPEQEFMILKATGRSRDGKLVEFGIHEQSFSSIVVEHLS